MCKLVDDHSQTNEKTPKDKKVMSFNSCLNPTCTLVFGLESVKALF